jgi:tetrahydromethanopterin S-methyltransferase subunit B
MQTLLPEIDDDFPLPRNAAEAMPALSPKEELDMRARTIKVLADLAGETLTPTQEHVEEATALAREMMSNPKMRPDYAKYPNETMAYLAGMVAQTNCMLVDELSELKMYVVNRLIMEIEEAKDSRSRIAALSKLGEVDGVDAFKKRSEVTVQIKPIEEVEKELLTILEGIEYSVEPENQQTAPK